MFAKCARQDKVAKMIGVRGQKRDYFARNFFILRGLAHNQCIGANRKIARNFRLVADRKINERKGFDNGTLRV
jgi:hypothetical protein